MFTQDLVHQRMELGTYTQKLMKYCLFDKELYATDNLYIIL